MGCIRFGDVVELIVRAPSENRSAKSKQLSNFRFVRVKILSYTTHVACNVNDWVRCRKFVQQSLAAAIQRKTSVADDDGASAISFQCVA